MSLLSLLVTTCGLALFSVSLFVSWKLCWVPLSGRFLPDVLKGVHFLRGDQQPVLIEVRWRGSDVKVKVLFISPNLCHICQIKQGIDARRLSIHTQNPFTNLDKAQLILRGEAAEVYIYFFGRHFYPKRLTTEGQYKCLQCNKIPLLV